eukprot:scaffold130413_cov60-Phaeocystis_antarctica.AAC.1
MHLVGGPNAGWWAFGRKRSTKRSGVTLRRLQHATRVREGEVRDAAQHVDLGCSPRLWPPKLRGEVSTLYRVERGR